MTSLPTDAARILLLQKTVTSPPLAVSLPHEEYLRFGASHLGQRSAALLESLWNAGGRATLGQSVITVGLLAPHGSRCGACAVGVSVMTVGGQPCCSRCGGPLQGDS